VRIIAIEWCTAAQAMEFRRPLQSSATVEARIAQLREKVSFMEVDRDLGLDLREAEKVLWKHIYQSY
jgi:histidine ammonia-lyase